MPRALTTTDPSGAPLAACYQGRAAAEGCESFVCGGPSCCTPFCSFRAEALPGGLSRPVLRASSSTRLLISYGRATGPSRFVFEARADARVPTPTVGEPSFPATVPGCEVAGPLPFGDAAAPADAPYIASVLNTSPASSGEIAAEVAFLYQQFPRPPTHITRPTGPDGLDQYLFTRDVFDRRRAVLNTLSGLLRIEHELTIGGDDTPSNQHATLRIEITLDLQTETLSGRASVGAYGVDIPPSELALAPTSTACNPVILLGRVGPGGSGSFNFATPFLDGDAAAIVSEEYRIVRQVGNTPQVPSDAANPDAGNCPAECCPGVCGFVAGQAASATVTSGPVAIAGPNPASAGPMMITRPIATQPPGCVRSFGGSDWPNGPNGVFIPQGRIARRLEFDAAREATATYIQATCRIDDATYRHFGFNTLIGPLALQSVPGAAGQVLEFSVRRDLDGFVTLLLSDGAGIVRQRDRTTDFTRPGASVSFSFDYCLNSVAVSGTIEESPFISSFFAQCDFSDQAVPCSGATAAASGCAGCGSDGGLVGVPVP